MVTFGLQLLLASTALFTSNVFATITDDGAVVPCASTSPTTVTNFDGYLSSMFLNTPRLPPDSAVYGLSKRSDLSYTGMIRRSIVDMLGKKFGIEAREAVAEEPSIIMARQLPNITSVDTSSWEANVTSSCMAQLSMMKNATNPAGMAVCYNVPYLDYTTGTFASDLRLYKISPPDAVWLAMGNNVSVSVQYNGAMVQLASTKKRRDLEERSPQSTPTTSGATVSVTGGPDLLKTFHFVGKVNSNTMPNTTNNMNATMIAMKEILTPNIALIGMNASGQMVNANISSDEAKFVTGVFATVAVNTTSGPFVLPGTKISIVPVGLFLYSGWFAVFLITVGYGTFERRMFRNQFRRRVAAKSLSSFKT